MSEEKVAEVRVTVTREFTREGKDLGFSSHSEETIAVRKFVTEPAKASVTMGMTISLGNFEFARIDVGLVVPCYMEEHEDAYEYAKKFVEKRTLEEAKEAKLFAQNRSSY